jgi:segregation and condensation protein A
MADWAPLDTYLMTYAVEPAMRKSVSASAFATVLELVREGVMEVRQDKAFEPLMLRRRADAPAKPAA